MYRTAPGVSCMLGPLSAEVGGYLLGCCSYQLPPVGPRPQHAKHLSDACCSLSLWWVLLLATTPDACMSNVDSSLRSYLLLLVAAPLQVKARRVGVRQAKRPAAAEVRPEELKHIHEEEKQETDRNMENMWRQLKRLGAGQRVLFTHLVCNHNSFAQTVENIFTLSFLVSTHTCNLQRLK